MRMGMWVNYGKKKKVLEEHKGEHKIRATKRGLWFWFRPHGQLYAERLHT